MRSLTLARAHARALLTYSAVMLLAACSNNDNPTQQPTPGTLAVAVAPAAVSVVAGAAGASAASIVRGGSFTGDVALTAEGAPTGVTVSFGTASLGAGVTSSTISIATTASVAAGSYPIAIKATGTGVSVAAATLTLTVTAAASGTVAVAVAPTSASIVAGASGTATATITRGSGFAGDVALTSSGAPTGMTVAFTPATVAAAATTSQITVSTTAATTAGTYPIVISAAGTGVTTATATVNVTVTAPASGSVVTVGYCLADAPKWFAWQDGPSGAWKSVAPNSVTATSQTYQFTASGTKIAIATVDTTGTAFGLNVIYATVAEANGFGGAQSNGRCGAKTVNGTIANVALTQAAIVTLGYASTFASPALSTSFTLTNVSTGALDLFAARIDATTQRADKLILRTGQDIANLGSLAVLDFNATEAFAPSSATVTLANIGTDTASVSSIYSGTRGSSFGFISTISKYLASSGAVAYDGIPSAKLGGGLQALFAASSAGSASRSAGIYFANPANQTITFGDPLSAPTLTRIAGGNYSRVQAQLPVQAAYNKSFSASFAQTSSNRTATITATTGYIGATATTWDFTIPLFLQDGTPGPTTPGGWLDTWGLVNGTPINWSVSANGGAFFLLDATVAPGTTFGSASKVSTTPLP